jgi:hypothetical protein
MTLVLMMCRGGEPETGLVRGVGVPGTEPGPRGAGAARCAAAAAPLRHPRRCHTRWRHPHRRRPRRQLPEGASHHLTQAINYTPDMTRNTLDDT